MPEETAAVAASSESEAVEEKPCSSSAAESSVDVVEEAKKLIGNGNRHLVMGDVVAAVGVFQEACAMLAERFGDTADECGEAFFLCGKSLLELARMENSVLGNALEGVPDESVDEVEKQNDSRIESADNLDEMIMDELREQVYEAMSERRESRKGEPKEEQVVKEAGEAVTVVPVETIEMAEPAVENVNNSTESVFKSEEQTAENVEGKSNEVGLSKQDALAMQETTKGSEQSKTETVPTDEEQTAENIEGESEVGPSKQDAVAMQETTKGSEQGKSTESVPRDEEQAAENIEGESEVGPSKQDAVAMQETTKWSEQGKSTESVPRDEEQAAENLESGKTSKQEDDVAKDVKEVQSTGQCENEDPAEPMEEDSGDDDYDDDDDKEADANAPDKEGEEEEVGNLQLAWEMLEVAKVIYKRKESKDDQLMAAQIFLKLGEVSAESGNYTQALEDFQECLNIQLKHLPPHSRLLAETHYQLGTTFSYTGQYSQAIQHFNNSIKVIESRLAMLQEVIDKAEGASEEKHELEELKQLLPEITEKVEDAKESQRTASAASEAIHQTLGGPSTSSGFANENGGSSTATQIALQPADGASSSKSASDISHLVRKKRKPDDESPKKDSDAKKVKQETTVNGSVDSASNSNGVQEKMEQEDMNSSTSAEATA